MTLKELHERIGWQLDGKLQERNQGEWYDRDASYNAPDLSEPAHRYRRTPDAPPMPDEVWLSDNQKPRQYPNGTFLSAHYSHDECTEWHGGNIHRYIRADSIIDGSKLQWRNKLDSIPWQNADVYEYRFKP